MFVITYDVATNLWGVLIGASKSLSPLKDFWQTFALEWFLIQTLFLYSYVRFISFQNYFRQLLALLWIIVLMSLYLAFYQLELFACFMFVAEFTIVIFFYTLFLHLRVSSAHQQQELRGSAKRAGCVLFTCAVATAAWTLIHIGGEYQYFANVYWRASNNTLNDLGFFAATVMRTNTAVHIFVGLTLLFLTFFLFFVVNVYYSLNLSRQDAFSKKNSKLAAQRGYYEQTAEEVQKVFENNQK